MDIPFRPIAGILGAMHVIAVGRAQHGPGHHFERHPGFPWWTLSWIERGMAHFTRALPRGAMSATVTGPALIAIPPSTPYRVDAAGVHETWIFIRPPARWQDWMEWPEALRGLRVHGAPPTAMIGAVASLHEAGDDRLLRDNACERILLLARPERAHHPMTAAALAAMEADLAAPHDLASLARTAGGSRSRLAEIFAAQIGLPPMAWLERRRMESACTLLLGTARSIQEVAATVGFANPFHFSTRFRRLIGKSPSAWRRSPDPWDQRRVSP